MRRTRTVPSKGYLTLCSSIVIYLWWFSTKKMVLSELYMASTFRSWDPSSSTPNCNPRSFEPLGWDQDEIEVLVSPPLDWIYLCWNHNLRWVSFPLPFFPRPDMVTTPQNAKCSHHNISLIRSPQVSRLCILEPFSFQISCPFIFSWWQWSRCSGYEASVIQYHFGLSRWCPRDNAGIWSILFRRSKPRSTGGLENGFQNWWVSSQRLWVS